MISREKEEAIRVHLKDGKSGHAIANLVGVSDDVVYVIKRMINIVSEMDSLHLKTIKNWLDKGASLSNIATRVPVERYRINAVKRFFYYHLPDSKPTGSVQCQECGAFRVSDEKFTGLRLNLLRVDFSKKDSRYDFIFNAGDLETVSKAKKIIKKLKQVALKTRMISR